MAFAIANGNFSATTTWDTGVAPTGSEDAYANSFTIQVTGTQSLGSVRNTSNDYYLPNTSIPLMTSSTSPSGIVTWSTQTAGSEAYRAFDRNTATLWQTTAGVQSGTITYQFPSTKIIKKYYWRGSATSTTTPRNFTFEGSNDGSTFTILNTQTLINVGANGIFTSPVLANTTPYLYYRLNVTSTNGGTLQIVEIEMTESTSTIVGQLLGGTFNLNDGSTLTVTASTGVVIGSGTPPITFALPSGNTATVNATIPSIAAITAYHAVVLNGLGTLNFTGNISCGGTSASNLRVINITAGGTLNYNGVCTNGGNSGNQTNSIFSSAAANINVITTGFAGGNAAATTNSSIYMSAGGNLLITNSGPITGGQSPAVTIIGGSATIVGSVNASATSPAIQNITTVTPIIDITGAITAGNGANGVVGLGLVKLNGLLFNTNRYMAVYTPQLTIDSTTTSWRLQTFAGPDIVLYASGAALGQPATNDVRFGTTYGATSEFTGTLRVPNPNTVLLGTLTDATTGTLLMTPSQFITELGTSSTAVAVRLQNCATVATTGDQVASYGV